MSANIILEIKASTGKIEEVKDFFREILPATRLYEGYISLDVLQNLDDPTELVISECWESREAYQQYFNWRAETGVFEKLASMIEGVPKVRFLENTGI
ncbi:MAG: putative quinol monooxygenase [Porticoccaceae bacterium]|nr:antibiotic biosynthesis monooxygenase [Pseudomonadales bacterium]MCP5171228.1 antibiotic biosynthesis monooxygenase [Pseudomonadales bacterium]MCP5301533.1 antibiotic biosynthesis monooxygenase [Pseudomonadales bacterium]